MNQFLIGHRGALGDFILTWPVLRSLKSKLSEYHFLGIGHKEYMDLAVKWNLLDSCISMESKGLDTFFSGTAVPPFLSDPNGAVLWFTQGHETAQLLRKISDLPVKVIKPLQNQTMHMAQYYYSVLHNTFSLPIPFSLNFTVVKSSGSKKGIVIHPGSGSISKNFAPDFYLRIACLLKKIRTEKVSIILGPAEIERGLAVKLRSEEIVLSDNIHHLTQVLSQASLFVGNDSGISHLAGVMGIPTIAFYKSTDPKVWGVMGKRVTHIVAHDEITAYKKLEEWVQFYSISTNQ